MEFQVQQQVSHSIEAMVLPPVLDSDYGHHHDHDDDLAVWLMTHLGDLRLEGVMKNSSPSLLQELMMMVVFCPEYVWGQSS